MGRNPSVTPPGLEISSPRDRYHKKLLFISIAVILLFFLAGVGILYFQNYSAPAVQQENEQTATTTNQNVPIPHGADTSTFSVIGTPAVTVNPEMYYTKDKDHVYFGNNILAGADPATFVLIPNVGNNTDLRSHFAKDKSNVYDSYFGTLLAGADPSSFVVLNYEYAKDKNNVYTLDPRVGDDPSTIILTGADPATFQLSSTTNSFDAQDKNHKYLNGEVVQ